MTSASSVIVAGARTPFGKFGSGFKDVPAKTLGAHAIRAALECVSLPDRPDDLTCQAHGYKVSPDLHADPIKTPLTARSPGKPTTIPERACSSHRG